MRQELGSNELNFDCLIFRHCVLCLEEAPEGRLQLRLRILKYHSIKVSLSAIRRSFPVKEVNFVFSASSVFLKWVSRC